ncbi:MAG TPA: hypothetical protein VMM76_10800 [Pirellulaceae bacterium]|nr:hypothetical protein [Pirellulaceae bacterium]
MNENRRRLFPDQNPFSTVAVKPGAIVFRFGSNTGVRGGTEAAGLVTKLQENNWRGEIVGPHGSGKSTLLQTLFPVIEAAGRDVRYYVAKPKDKQLPMSAADQATWNESTQVVIEGYELMSRRNRKLLDRACRSRDAGLLITCHTPQGLPTLFHTAITVELAISLVEQLLPPDCNFISASDVRDSFARHGQNLRELLFEMYDLYERCRPR